MAESDRFKLQERLENVQASIRSAALASGRDPSDIELIVVTKGKTAAIIKDLVELGMTAIGESYLKEAMFKQELLREFDINWQMIGVIQKGKARQVTEGFSQIHSVDRLDLAEDLQLRAANINKVMPIYLELNLSGEDTKHGWKFISEEERKIFFEDVERILKFDALDVKGLMTMAPYSTEQENSRKYFKSLRSVRDLMVDKYDVLNNLGLSMGMSNDYEVAIEEGATALRIGSAIVGER